MPYTRAAFGCKARYQSTKNAGTHLSRKKHYLESFLPSIKLAHNPLLEGFSHETKVTILASYAAYLLSGATILAISIRVGTVKLYLKAVADYFHDHRKFNPTLDETGAQPELLRSLYHEASRWEKMPNRAEPLTPDIVEFFHTRAQSAHENSAIAAIADWMILGLQTGFRVSEYAQSHSSMTKPLHETVTKNVDSTSKAFIASDFTFFGANRRPIAKNKRHTAPFVHIILTLPKEWPKWRRNSICQKQY